MAEPGSLGDVQNQVVTEGSQKLSHEPSESFLCVFQFEDNRARGLGVMTSP